MHGSSPTNNVPEPGSARSSFRPEPSNQNSQAPMTKTFNYCNGLPSKAAEDAERAHEVKREPVQIRDANPLPQSHSRDNSTLYKAIDEFDLGTQKLPIRDCIAFNKVFCHWPKSVVQNIQAGHKHYVTICDDTDCNHSGSHGNNNSANRPLYFRGLNVYFAKFHRTGHYFLNLSDIFVARQIKVGDIIIFRWDTQKGCFFMKAVSVKT